MSIKIDQAFVSTILSAGLQLDVVHENGLYTVWDGANYAHFTGVYTPTAGREYVEIKHFPAGKAAFSFANSDESVGVFQAIVKYPVDAGAFEAKRKAEEIIEEFKVGKILTYQSQDVQIISNSRDGGRPEGGFYQIVVRSNYRAITPR